MWPFPWVTQRLYGGFPRKERNEHVCLLISWGELGMGEILPQFPGHLGEGSMEIKHPQASLDRVNSLDNPEDLLGKIIYGNRI